MKNTENASPPAAPVQSGEPVVVEAWHGERKVTIYPDCVLRVWGTNIESEMSDEPRTLQTVQDAMDWLYAAPQSSQPVEGGERTDLENVFFNAWWDANQESAPFQSLHRQAAREIWRAATEIANGGS